MTDNGIASVFLGSLLTGFHVLARLETPFATGILIVQQELCERSFRRFSLCRT